jgi:hypothetical protein
MHNEKTSNDIMKLYEAVSAPMPNDIDVPTSTNKLVDDKPNDPRFQKTQPTRSENIGKLVLICRDIVKQRAIKNDDKVMQLIDMDLIPLLKKLENT